MSAVIDPRFTSTPVLGLKMPDIGGDIDTWGGDLNSNFVTLDNSLLTTGGAMSGRLTLSGNPQGPLDAVTKQYADASAVTTSDSPPANPSHGTLWWDSAGLQLYIWYADPTSSQWVPVTSVSPTAGGTVDYINATSGLFSGIATLAMRQGNVDGIEHRTWVGLADNGYMSYFDECSLAAFYPPANTVSPGTVIGAVTAVRASDVVPQPGEVPSAMGFGAYAVSDDTRSGAAATWCYYGSGRKLSGSLPCFLMELSMGNLDPTRPDINPFQGQPTGSTYGIWLTSGSEAYAAGETVYPAGVGLAFASNGSTWDKGIVFVDGGLTKDGNGHSKPVQIPTGGEIQWTFDNTGARSSFIRCDATAANVGIVFAGNGLNVVNAAESAYLFEVNASAINAYNPISAISLTTSGVIYANGVIGAFAGVGFPTAAANAGDLSKHLDLSNDGSSGLNYYGGQINFNVGASGSYNFQFGGASVGIINSTGINYIPIGQTGAAAGIFTTVATGGSSGPTWTSGTAAPSSTQPVGSLYSRVGGAVGATLYVSRGGGTWNAVAAV